LRLTHPFYDSFQVKSFLQTNPFRLRSVSFHYA
jgi:hypothetical protein